MSTYTPLPHVIAPELPLFQLGGNRDGRRIVRTEKNNSVAAPRIPLYQLGYMGTNATGPAQAVAIAAPIAAKTASTVAKAAGLISAAGPIGVAVGAAISIIAGLLAAHEQRLQNAKTENARASAAVSSFYSTLEQIVAAYNAGQVSLSDAISGLQQLDAVTYSQLHSFVGQTGTAWQSSQPGVCNKSCTVGCCLYNTYLHPDVYGYGAVKGILSVMTANGGTVGVGNIPSNKYGFPAMTATPVTVLPAAQIPGQGQGTNTVSGAVSDVASTVESALSSITGGSSSSSGSSSGLMLAALAIGAFLLLR